MAIDSIEKLNELKDKSLKKLFPSKPVISVGLGTCGMGNSADKVFEAIQNAVKAKKADINVRKTGCFGFCAEETLVNIYMPGRPLVILNRVQPKDAVKIVQYALKGEIPASKALCKIEEWDFITSSAKFGIGFEDIPVWNEIPFFKGQKKIVLRDAGLIDPESMEEYTAIGGYQALYKAVKKMNPDSVLDEMKKSKLRGRGGAGFPTGTKWEIMKKVQSDKKYVICNADEGDPGAYMNRNEIESDPHALIEGMAIGAYVMGADEGIIYCRAEYPLAVERLTKAIADARAAGLLGKNIFGSNFNFDISVIEGAGAFVCGEETALIASVEGKAGRPIPRPPFPAQKGLNGKPTNINNVETWVNVAPIIYAGGDSFAKTGTDKSTGTKVFSLVGKVKNTGLVELPLGTRLLDIVYSMGGGTGSRKKIKAVQTGGPSGGCIPVNDFETPVDYESLASLGAIMGSGGMVVMDQDNCMVDVARYFIEFTYSESCGKCTPCREGLAQMLEILNRITKGSGTLRDLDTLEKLAYVIKDSSLCGLGQTSSNPVLTTLKHFRHEYEEHINDKRCDAGVCENLFLALCENSCPMHMNIPGYLQLLKEGRLEEAFELTLRDNPIPGTVGRICYFHCKMRCRRESVDESVSQGEIHRYLADTMYKMGKEKNIYKELVKEKMAPTGKKIAIVGAGPSGLAAAFYLVRLGHEVTVYDQHEKPGGILRYGIPEYRLPKDVLDKELAVFKLLGVKFSMNTKVGKDIKFSKLMKDNDIVFTAIGAQKDTSLGILGEKLGGVYPGYEFLEDYAKGHIKKIGKKAVVIGAGNVAIDAARTLLRLGSDVTIVYRRDRDEMPANEHEIKDAEAEKIKFRFMCAPQKLIGDAKGCVTGLEVSKMKFEGFDKAGRKKPIMTNETEVISCDMAILAIGEKVDFEYAAEAGVAVQKNGSIKVNPHTFKTTNPKIYAGGDAVTGPATVSEAMGIAIRAAEAIDFELTGERRFDRLYKEFEYKNEVPLKPEGGRQSKVKTLAVKERTNNFQEVMAGYTGEQALREAVRCLRCDVKDCAGKN